MTRPLAAFAISLVLALAACGSSPSSTFYALAPAGGAAQPLPLRRVLVRRPGLAGYLDRPEIVLAQDHFRLGIAQTDRWAEPLDRMIGRVLAQDLGARLTASSVFTDEGAITVDPDATVEVDVHRFDVGDRGELTLEVQVAVERGTDHAAAATRSVRLQEPVRGASTSALVAAMSSLLGQLADQISVTLKGV